MPSLPTPGAATGTWGTALNEFLTVAHNADGTLIGGGASGGASQSPEAYQLAASALAGATTLTLDHVPKWTSGQSVKVLVGAYTSACEIRGVTSFSGTTMTVAALSNAHSSGDAVIVITGSVTPHHFGAVGNGTINDSVALQAAVNACRLAAVWLDGGGSSYVITETLVFPQSVKVRNFGQIKAGGGGNLAGANDWMGITCQDTPQSFTVDTTTDTFTTSVSHGIGGAPNMIIFKGASLPAPLVSGRIYYVDTKPSTTTFTVSATSAGAKLDITTAGSGAMMAYPDVAALEKVYLDDVYFYGNTIAINGFKAQLQQPTEIKKLRVDACSGTGVQIGGQQYILYNTEIIGCGTGLDISGTEPYFYGLNVEACTVRGVQLSAQYGGFWGAHLESNPIHVHIASTADVRAFVIDGVIFSNGTTADVKCDTDLSDYEIRGMAHYGGSGTSVVIQDTVRGYTITKAFLGVGAVNYEPLFVQQRGANAPLTMTIRYAYPNTDYTIGVTDKFVWVDATAAARTITLPPVAKLAGMIVTISRRTSGANNVVIDGNASETINGATTYTLTAQYQTVTLFCTSSEWIVVST